MAMSRARGKYIYHPSPPSLFLCPFSLPLFSKLTLAFPFQVYCIIMMCLAGILFGGIVGEMQASLAFVPKR